MNATTRKLVENGYATVAQAAAHMGVSDTTVYHLIRGGVISHAKHAGKYVIPWTAIYDYEAQRLTIGSVA